MSAQHAKASNTVQAMADRMPLAVSFSVREAERIFSTGARLSQRELHRRGICGPVDPQCDEARLGTDDDVFMYASTFRYRPGHEGNSEPAWGVGLLYAPEMEEQPGTGEKTATPFDSGSVFRFLRPNDTEDQQRQFVRSHELPVPDYRKLLAQYLDHCFDAPGDYLSDVGPNAQWPLVVQGGDARRWTFEVRFRVELPINEAVKAVFFPNRLTMSEAFQDQWDRWEASGVEVRTYLATRGSDEFDRLEQEGREYISEMLGLA